MGGQIKWQLVGVQERSNGLYEKGEVKMVKYVKISVPAVSTAGP